jgi:glycosyltransferase involved in cell wall biosynthesis
VSSTPRPAEERGREDFSLRDQGARTAQDAKDDGSGTGAPVLLFVVNVAWYFCLHRLRLAQAARAAGFSVHVAAAPDATEDVKVIKENDFEYHELNLHRGTGYLVEQLRLTWTLRKLYRQVNPSIVHHITIKPVLSGTLAARWVRVPAILNTMSGLGFVFTARGAWAHVRRSVVVLAYRLLFAHGAVRVIFENGDDARLFVARGLVKRDQVAIIRGAGVDLEAFGDRGERDGVTLVLLPGRMLWDKGVREFCAAAKELRSAGVAARFALVGGLDAENPSAIPESWLAEQQRNGAVEWWGHQRDMDAAYGRARIVCLPSYREGLPTVLLEAAVSGCALVAADVPGCREVIQHGVTGLLVPPRDVAALARALHTLIADQALCARLCKAAQELVASQFSAETIQRSTLALYDQMLGAGRSLQSAAGRDCD